MYDERVASPWITIRPILESDWADYRDFRLQMLAEIPIAFGETLATARARSEAGWRSRTRLRGGVRLVAIDERSGRWAGTMGGLIEAQRGLLGALLVGVYVDPAYRGRSAGVTDALLDAVEEWARPLSRTLALHVHEDNARARAAYRHRGFRDTGTTIPYVLDPATREVEMAKAL